MTLEKYLKRHNLSDAEFGEKIGKSRSYVWRLRKKERTPSLELANRIKEITGGDVTFLDFLKAA